MSGWCPCGDPECDGKGGQRPASPPPAAMASAPRDMCEKSMEDPAFRRAFFEEWSKDQAAIFAEHEAEVAALRAERDAACAHARARDNENGDYRVAFEEMRNARNAAEAEVARLTAALAVQRGCTAGMERGSEEWRGRTLAAEAALAALRERCGTTIVNGPWSAADVLEKLAEAGEILLNRKDYDGHGWELIQGCVPLAREYAPALRALASVERGAKP